jgi:hypothetical protein
MDHAITGHKYVRKLNGFDIQMSGIRMLTIPRLRFTTYKACSTSFLLFDWHFSHLKLEEKTESRDW